MKAINRTLKARVTLKHWPSADRWKWMATSVEITLFKELIPLQCLRVEDRSDSLPLGNRTCLLRVYRTRVDLRHQTKFPIQPRQSPCKYQLRWRQGLYRKIFQRGILGTIEDYNWPLELQVCSNPSLLSQRAQSIKPLSLSQKIFSTRLFRVKNPLSLKMLLAPHQNEITIFFQSQ